MTINLSGQNPTNGSKSNDLDTLISFVVEKQNIDISRIQINIAGETAYKNSGFLPRFISDNSSVSVQSNSASFVFERNEEFKKDSLIEVRIYYFDESGSDTKRYSFRTVQDKPILYFSNLSDGLVVTEPIVFRLEFVDELDGVDLSSLNIKLNGKEMVSSGTLASFLSTVNSKIEPITGGYGVTLEHEDFFRDGNYELYYDVKDSGGARLIDRINFSVKIRKVILPKLFPSYNFIGFVNGLKKVTPLENGVSAKLEWAKLISRVPKSEVYALIYYGKDRLSLFDSLPKFIAKKEVNEFTYNEFSVGSIYYFAVRAMEAFSGIFDFTGMTESATDVYKFPSETSISSIFSTSALTLEVEDVTGYPEKGLLLVDGSEVVKYTSVNRDTNSFNIPANGRGLNSTTKIFGVEGDSVKLFIECQDKNNNIIKATTMYQDGYDSGREVDNIGILVTDYSDNDKKFFQGFDYCGYHHPMPDRLLKGLDDCGTYLGGEFNGSRGMNLYDRMLNREEVLLEQVGEPCILLQRKWTGAMCDCMTARNTHPKEKTCNRCFGTGYIGGFDQFLNRRRNDRRVLIRFKETAEDLELHMSRHMSVKFEPQCWTLPIPAIKDRDIIIRFDFTDDLEYFYEVLDCSKEKLVYGHYGRQNLRLKRLDKTDLINTFSYIK